MVLRRLFILARKSQGKESTRNKYFISKGVKYAIQAHHKLFSSFQPNIFSYIKNSQAGFNFTISCSFHQPFNFSPFISLNKKE